ncbi:BTB/POZ domain-containing protein 9-like [Drosophila obscura]|uniref:BTB/POZ domain-containing protein 9-like n=1 Tax=Drosophila obscura TaxID=7282 RepID=UPI001BB250F9|nr:BTB/POZ domain-containing protein 9-like [Drosophila obscura]
MNSQESNAISSSEKTVIKLTDRLSSDMGRLCLNELYSDVSFIVEDQSLPAHCLILAARSEYFRAMLYGGMAESQQRQIQLPEVPLEAFKVILGYLYSATMEIFTLDVAAHIKVLRLANQYGLVEVESALSGHLQENLSVSNVCMILKTARLYNLNELAEKCLKFMDRNGSKLMADDSFQKLSLESLKEILRRDTFVAYEGDIFLSVYEWIQHNPSVDRKSVLSLIRLPIIGVDDLVRVVRPTGNRRAGKNTRRHR